MSAAPKRKQKRVRVPYWTMKYAALARWHRRQSKGRQYRYWAVFILLPDEK